MIEDEKKLNLIKCPLPKIIYMSMKGMNNFTKKEEKTSNNTYYTKKINHQNPGLPSLKMSAKISFSPSKTNYLKGKMINNLNAKKSNNFHSTKININVSNIISKNSNNNNNKNNNDNKKPKMKDILNSYGLDRYYDKFIQYGIDEQNFYQIGSMNKKSLNDFINILNIFPSHTIKVEQLYLYLKKMNYDNYHSQINTNKINNAKTNMNFNSLAKGIKNSSKDNINSSSNNVNYVTLTFHRNNNMNNIKSKISPNNNKLKNKYHYINPSLKQKRANSNRVNSEKNKSKSNRIINHSTRLNLANKNKNKSKTKLLNDNITKYNFAPPKPMSTGRNDLIKYFFKDLENMGNNSNNTSCINNLTNLNIFKSSGYPKKRNFNRTNNNSLTGSIKEINQEKKTNKNNKNINHYYTKYKEKHSSSDNDINNNLIQNYYSNNYLQETNPADLPSIKNFNNNQIKINTHYSKSLLNSVNENHNMNININTNYNNAHKMNRQRRGSNEKIEKNDNTKVINNYQVAYSIKTFFNDDFIKRINNKNNLNNNNNINNDMKNNNIIKIPLMKKEGLKDSINTNNNTNNNSSSTHASQRSKNDLVKKNNIKNSNNNINNKKLKLPNVIKKIDMQNGIQNMKTKNKNIKNINLNEHEERSKNISDSIINNNKNEKKDKNKNDINIIMPKENKEKEANKNKKNEIISSVNIDKKDEVNINKTNISEKNINENKTEILINKNKENPDQIKKDNNININKENNIININIEDTNNKENTIPSKENIKESESIKISNKTTEEPIFNEIPPISNNNINPNESNNINNKENNIISNSLSPINQKRIEKPNILQKNNPKIKEEIKSKEDNQLNNENTLEDMIYESLRLNRSFSENKKENIYLFDLEFLCRCLSLCLSIFIETSKESPHITEINLEALSASEIKYFFFNDVYNDNINFLFDLFDKEVNADINKEQISPLDKLELFLLKDEQRINFDVNYLKHIKKDKDEILIKTEEEKKDRKGIKDKNDININNNTNINMNNNIGFKIRGGAGDIERDIKFIDEFFSMNNRRKKKAKNYNFISDMSKNILCKELSYINEIDSELNGTNSNINNTNLGNNSNNNININDSMRTKKNTKEENSSNMLDNEEIKEIKEIQKNKDDEDNNNTFNNEIDELGLNTESNDDNLNKNNNIIKDTKEFDIKINDDNSDNNKISLEKEEKLINLEENKIKENISTIPSSIKNNSEINNNIIEQNDINNDTNNNKINNNALIEDNKVVNMKLSPEKKEQNERKETEEEDNIYESDYILDITSIDELTYYLIKRAEIFDEDFNYILMKIIERRYIPTPEPQTIFDFMADIIILTKMEKEVVVLSLIYIERLIYNTGLLLTSRNWRRILLTAMIIASKIWDDNSFENSHFSQVFANLGINEINTLERIFLEMINYKVYVKQSEYFKYLMLIKIIALKYSYNGKEIVKTSVIKNMKYQEFNETMQNRMRKKITLNNSAQF